MTNIKQKINNEKLYYLYCQFFKYILIRFLILVNYK